MSVAADVVMLAVGAAVAEELTLEELYSGWKWQRVAMLVLMNECSLSPLLHAGLVLFWA